MSTSTYKSDSTEQQIAGHAIFEKVQEWLGIELSETVRVDLSDGAYIQPDFYSEDEGVVGEIFKDRYVKASTAA